MLSVAFRNCASGAVIIEKGLWISAGKSSVKALPGLRGLVAYFESSKTKDLENRWQAANLVEGNKVGIK